jgi:isoleucyl-tRNA synthetase
MAFREFPRDQTLPEVEKEVLDFWESHDTFRKSVTGREGATPFVFFEGPPTANGRPGAHHVLARTIKDIVCRYKTMTGHRVDRKAGWDTHGLPVEIEVEKDLDLETKDDIEEYGVREFTKSCRASVFKYKDEWDTLTRRMAYWIDLGDAYITCTNEYVESVWHLLRLMWDRGLIYKGHKILPYCPRCGTPLSSHEVSLGYREADDPSIHVRFPMREDERSARVPRGRAGLRRRRGPVRLREDALEGRAGDLLPRLDHDTLDLDLERRPRGRAEGVLRGGQPR